MKRPAEPAVGCNCCKQETGVHQMTEREGKVQMLTGMMEPLDCYESLEPTALHRQQETGLQATRQHLLAAAWLAHWDE